MPLQLTQQRPEILSVFFLRFLGLFPPPVLSFFNFPWNRQFFLSCTLKVTQQSRHRWAIFALPKNHPSPIPIVSSFAEPPSLTGADVLHLLIPLAKKKLLILVCMHIVRLRYRIRTVQTKYKKQKWASGNRKKNYKKIRNDR